MTLIAGMALGLLLGLLNLPAARAAYEWRDPQIISDDTGLKLVGANIAASSDGQVLSAIWSNSRASYLNPQVATSLDAGATWSDPEYLVEEAVNYSAYTSNWVAPDGSAAVGVYQGNFSGSVWHSRWTASSQEWTDPEAFDTGGTPQPAPRLAGSSQKVNGHYVVTATWLASGVSTTAFSATSQDSGATWNDPVEVATLDGGLGTLFVSADGSTQALAFVNSGSASIAVSQDSGAHWSDPIPVVPSSGAQPPVVNGTPDASVLFVGDQGGGSAFLASTTDLGDHWNTAMLTPPAGASSVSGIVPSTDGSTATAIVTANDSGKGNAWVTRTSDTGVHWSTAETIAPESDTSLDRAAVSGSADGRAISVTWPSTSGGSEELTLATSEDSGESWSVHTIEGATFFSGPATVVSADARETSSVWTRANEIYTVGTFTPPESPAAPSAVAALGGAAVTVEKPAPGDAPITGMELQAHQVGVGSLRWSRRDGGSVVCSDSGSSCTCTVTGLIAGADYNFTAAALNQYGTGPASDPSNTVTALGPTPVPTPTTSPSASPTASPSPTVTPTPTPTPTPTGGVQVKAAKKTKKLRSGKRTKLVKSVTTGGGNLSRVKAQCLFQNHRVKKKDRKDLCSFKMTRSTSNARVWVTPKCATGLKARVHIVVRNVPGEGKVAWQRTWRVARDTSDACYLHGNG